MTLNVDVTKSLATKCLAFLTIVSLFFVSCQSSTQVAPDSQTIMPQTREVIPTQTPPVHISSPVVSSPLVSATNEQSIKTYRGANSYRGEHIFEIQYDSLQWKYEEGDPFGPVLVNLKIQGCFFPLLIHGTGPNDIEIGSIQLAGRKWMIFKTEASHLSYRSSPFELLVFIMRDTPIEHRIACRHAAEIVIGTFQSISE